MNTEFLTYTLKFDAFEGGVLMGLIEAQDEPVKQKLSGIRRQLIELKRSVEEAAGVVKELLPNGILKITDEDGNLIIRPPYSWEIEGN